MSSILFSIAATAQNKPAAAKTDTLHKAAPGAVKALALPPKDTTHKPVADTAKALALPRKDTTHKPLSDTVKTPALPHKDGVHKVIADTAKVSLRKDSSWYVPGGIRFGIDLSRIASAIYYPYRKEFTVVADARINSDLYAAFEAGYASTPYSDSNYTYKGNGMFVTLGVDYNFLKRQYHSEQNMFYGGIRYGFSHFNYTVPSYSIKNTYWGDHLTGSVPKTNANAHWIELLVGLRAEILKNFFMGWNIRERILINNVKTDEIAPIVIPGFGNGSKRSVFDVQYTVSYIIPFYRLKEYAPDLEAKKKKIPKR